MRALAREWIVALALVGLLVLAAAPAGPTYAAGPETGNKKCSDGIDNDGDGLIDGADPDCAGDGGGDPGSPSIFAVTVSGDYVLPPGPCDNADGSCDNQATIDEDKSTRFNTHKRNPGDPYHVRANLYALNNINVSGLVLTNVPGNGSCTDFFAARGGAGAVVDHGAGTVTWTGFMQASIWLDLTAAEGKYDRRLPATGPTWSEIGAGRDIKGRITAPNLMWNLRFDDEWSPDGASVYDTFPDKAQDGSIVPFETTGDGINDSWNVAISGRVLAQSFGGDGLAAMCNASLTWSVTRNP